MKNTSENTREILSDKEYRRLQQNRKQNNQAKCVDCGTEISKATHKRNGGRCGDCL